MTNSEENNDHHITKEKQCEHYRHSTVGEYAITLPSLLGSVRLYSPLAAWGLMDRICPDILTHITILTLKKTH